MSNDFRLLMLARCMRTAATPPTVSSTDTRRCSSIRLNRNWGRTWCMMNGARFSRSNIAGPSSRCTPRRPRITRQSSMRKARFARCTPQVSKFRHMPFDFSDDERGRIYQQYIAASAGSRAQQHGGVLPRDLRRVEGLPAQRPRDCLGRIQPGAGDRRGEDSHRDARGAFPARRAESLVGIRGHQETSGSPGPWRTTR